MRLHQHLVKEALRRAYLKTKETAEDSAQRKNGQDYAEQQLENSARDGGNLTLDAVRTPFMQYRAIQAKREARIQSVSRKEAASAKNAAEETTQIAHKELRKQYMKKAALRRAMARGGAGKATKASASAAEKMYETTAPLRRKIAKTALKIANKVKDWIVAAVVKITEAIIASLPGWAVVLLVVVLIGAVLYLLAGPLGIFATGEAEGLSLPAIVAETNADFGKSITDLIAANPDCTDTEIQYIQDEGHSWSESWPEILAAFSVDTSLNYGEDVIVFDETKKDHLRRIFNYMNEITSRVEEVPQTETSEKNQEAEKILHIRVITHTTDYLAWRLEFDVDEKEMYHQMLNAEMRPYLVALIDTPSALPGGILLWPLPGYTRLTTLFGEVDAFGKPGHRGIDIPALANTPIHAAHGGTVKIAREGELYGNYVKLDSGTGTETIYAHMTSYCVAPGETVSPGQVIGYVGSTGNSTGNHLHFELLLNGTLVDPLLYVPAA